MESTAPKFTVAAAFVEDLEEPSRGAVGGRSPAAITGDDSDATKSPEIAREKTAEKMRPRFRRVLGARVRESVVIDLYQTTIGTKPTCTRNERIF
jgi:hypothetical protein